MVMGWITKALHVHFFGLDQYSLFPRVRWPPTHLHFGISSISLFSVHVQQAELLKCRQVHILTLLISRPRAV